MPRVALYKGLWKLTDIKNKKQKKKKNKKKKREKRVGKPLNATTEQLELKSDFANSNALKVREVYLKF